MGKVGKRDEVWNGVGMINGMGMNEVVRNGEMGEGKA